MNFKFYGAEYVIFSVCDYFYFFVALLIAKKDMFVIFVIVIYWIDEIFVRGVFFI